mgnify:CR=1 FL=1
METKEIEHDGWVLEIHDNLVKVNIMAQAACASCNAKGVCSAADVEEKIIEVSNPRGDFRIGERVKVYMEQSLGFKALFLGYVLPFILVMIALIVTQEFTTSEGIIGLVALGLLPIYYLLLYQFKDHIKKQFSFKLKKIS